MCVGKIELSVMLPISKETKSFLIILDSNLKFQSLALVLNLLETQGSGRRILIYYVYDSVDDKLEYRELVNSVYQSFGFSNQIEYL